MQWLSACRNRSSPIHRFSSTRMRCITAIWPAGPPKDNAAMCAHTFTASRKGIAAREFSASCAAGARVFIGIPAAIMALAAAAYRSSAMRTSSKSRALKMGLLASAFVAAPPLNAQPAPAAWTAVDAALGRAGTTQPDGVRRYGFPRADLHVQLDGVTIRPALALGSWLAFQPLGARR